MKKLLMTVAAGLVAIEVLLRSRSSERARARPLVTRARPRQPRQRPWPAGPGDWTARGVLLHGHGPSGWDREASGRCRLLDDEPVPAGDVVVFRMYGVHVTTGGNDLSNVSVKNAYVKVRA